MKFIATILFFFLFLAGAFSQTRNVLVNTSSVVIQPTNFWSVDASNARSGLGLGSAATNPSTAFQPSSTILSNFALSNTIYTDGNNIALYISGNGSVFNIVASDELLTAGYPASVGSIGFGGNVFQYKYGTNSTDWGNVVYLNQSGWAGIRTNLELGESNDVTFSNVNTIGLTIVDEVGSQIAFEGSSADITRTNLGIGATWLTNTSVTNFRSAIGLVLSALTNTNITNFRSDIGLSWFALTNTNASNFRTSVELGLSALTNTNITNFRSAVGLGWYALTNTNATNFRSDIGLGLAALTNTNVTNFRSDIGIGWSALTNTNAENFRSSIGLGWSALTNTNTENFQLALYGSGTNPVLVNSNGGVVFPTNFWQQAPIQTYVQTFIPAATTNSYATNARNLYVYSMTSSISGVTNTIVLPTDAATFNGDSATVTHTGTTNSVTSISGDGGSTILVSISNNAESVKFIYEANQWTFYHNISFTEPFRFADGNIEENKATSRTNLGLGFHALTNVNTTNFQAAIFSTNTAPTNTGNIAFGSAAAWIEINVHTNGTTNSFRIPIFKAP